MKRGIEEQEQNGVIAPKSDAKKLPQPLVPAIQDLILACDKKLRINPMAEIITNKSSIIFTES